MPNDFRTRRPRPDPVSVPDTPEQLFEQLAEPTLRELFPSFDELGPFNQKLVRLLHTELVKGALTDGTFQESLCFILMLWRSFNADAMNRNDERLEQESDIDELWIQAATEFHRMDQYLGSLLALLDTMPPEDEGAPLSSWSQYRLRSSLEAD